MVFKGTLILQSIIMILKGHDRFLASKYIDFHGFAGIMG